MQIGKARHVKIRQGKANSKCCNVVIVQEWYVTNCGAIWREDHLQTLRAILGEFKKRWTLRYPNRAVLYLQT